MTGRSLRSGQIVLDLIGRSEDVITASITTTVVMVVAAISPQHAWTQPIGLKLATRIPNRAPAGVGQIRQKSIR
jgi:hypothetical protein